MDSDNSKIRPTEDFSEASYAPISESDTDMTEGAVHALSLIHI